MWDRADCSRNLDGTPEKTRDFGCGVKGRVWITFGSGRLDHSWGVFGTHYRYTYSAEYEYSEGGERRKVFLSSEYSSVEQAWQDVEKFCHRLVTEKRAKARVQGKRVSA